MEEIEDLDEKHGEEYRKLELHYEQLFNEIDDARKACVNGTNTYIEDTVKQYDILSKTTDTSKVITKDVDVTDTTHLEGNGIANFWLRAMMNHPSISDRIGKKDRPILALLTDIQLKQHKNDFGFDLVFRFDDKVKEYFLETKLIKSFTMFRKNIITGCEQTKINWKENKDTTFRKQKKKRNGKRVFVNIQVKSFFSFFDYLRIPSEKDL